MGAQVSLGLIYTGTPHIRFPGVNQVIEHCVLMCHCTFVVNQGNRLVPALYFHMIPPLTVEKCTVIGSYLVSALCQEVATSGALFGILEFGTRAALLYRPLVDVAWTGCRRGLGHTLKQTSVNYRHMGAGDHPRTRTYMPFEVSLYLCPVVSLQHQSRWRCALLHL